MLSDEGSKFTRVNFQKIASGCGGEYGFGLRFNSRKELEGDNYKLTRRAHIEVNFTKLDSQPLDLPLD